MAMSMQASLWHKAFMVVAEECTLRGLRPGSNYRMRIRALNHVGAGETSEPVDVKTSSSIPFGAPGATCTVCMSTSELQS